MIGCLLGSLTNALETGVLILAHDLPLCDRIKNELEIFDVKFTAAGNTVLDVRAAEHHADLAAATAIALYLSNSAPQPIGAGTLAGMY